MHFLLCVKTSFLRNLFTIVGSAINDSHFCTFFEFTESVESLVLATVTSENSVIAVQACDLGFTDNSIESHTYCR